MEHSAPVSRREWTLAALALAGDRGLSPVQLQKCLFLLWKEMPQAVGQHFYHFDAYDYGPFSREICNDAEYWAEQGMAKIAVPAGQKWNLYAITEGGRHYADDLMRYASSPAVGYLERVVQGAQGLLFERLVRAIYKKYPEYRENSVFRG